MLAKWVFGSVLLYQINNALGQCDGQPFVIADWIDNIRSPSYPKYETYMDCRWIMTVSQGNTIDAKFSDFAMIIDDDAAKLLAPDCSNAENYVTMYDGNTTTSPMLKKYCGEIPTGTDVSGDWDSIITSGNQLLIHMVTGGKITNDQGTKTERGFLIDVKGVCQRKVTQLNGIIQTPKYPGQYPFKSECEWVIDFGYGFNTTLEFTDFKLESQPNCSYDYVALHHGPSSSFPMLGEQHCGIINSFPPTIVHGPLTIVFTADDDTEYEGFESHYSSTDLDECVVGSECSKNAFCTNTIGSFICQCKFSYAGDGRTCTWAREYNECADPSKNNCHESANCIDTREEFYCECKPGHIGDGISCQDSNECLLGTHNCHQNATCANTIGSFTCMCVEVYVGDGVHCTDRNECSLGLHDCHEDAVCVNTDGSFTCRCSNGFYGDGYTCQDINECKDNRDECDVNADCANIKGSYTCTCHQGFQGDGKLCQDVNECEVDLDNCDENASCNNTFGGFQCTCNIGYQGNGVQCQDIGECELETDTCHEDARCSNTDGSYTCTCNLGYQGDGALCTDLDECDFGTDICDEQATCTNNKGSYVCTCNMGYHGNGTYCSDTNECEKGTHTCHKEATCENSIGSFHCACNHGFQGDGQQCEDIDECQSNTHNCHRYAACSNSYGSFSCACFDGYRGNGTACADVNECDLNLHGCSADAYCTNQMGAFNCTCNTGYSGDGFKCEDVNECEEAVDNCHKEATCTNSLGSFGCKCNQGYRGDGTVCKDIEECLEKIDNCHTDAICTNTFGSFGCQCKQGLTGNGTHCKDILECSTGTHDCHKSATCIEKYASFECRCNEGFKGNGVACQDINECEMGELNICNEHASCTNFLGSFKCTCFQGFLGDGFACVDIHECEEGSDNCHNSAQCTNTLGGFDCQCRKGFTGDGVKCQDIDECQNTTNVCSKVDGVCSNTYGSYTCSCKQGTIGDGIVCQKSMAVYLVVVSILDIPWSNNLLNPNSEYFSTTSLLVKSQVDELYKDESRYLATEVKMFRYGSVRTTMKLDFQPKESDVIERLKASFTRGKLHNLHVDVTSFSVRRLEAGCSGCSMDSYCSSNGTDDTCYCMEGFEGDGVNCVDTDECLNLNGGCQQRCGNEKATFLCSCNAGFVLQNDQRTCLVNDSYHAEDVWCKGEYMQGVYWEETVAGRVVYNNCPNNKRDGVAERICTEDATWINPNLKNCVKQELIQVKQRMEAMYSENTTFETFWVITNTVANSIIQETLPSFNVLYAGDVIEVLIMLRILVREVANQRHKSVTITSLQTLLDMFTSIISNVLDKSNHQAWDGITNGHELMEWYLEEIENLATIFSNVMIDIMHERSVKQPEFIDQLKLSTSHRNEITFLIEVVEMKRFNGVNISQSTEHSSNSILYPKDLFVKETESLIQSRGLYHALGCWADYSQESAILKLETKHALLRDHFLNRAQAVDKCARVADSLHYNVFALQDGGMCAAGPNFHLTYDADGEALNCNYGKGGRLANDVYELNKFYTSLLTISYGNLATLILHLTKNNDSMIQSSSSEVKTSGGLVTTKILKYGPYGTTSSATKVEFVNQYGNDSDSICVQVKKINGTLSWSSDDCNTNSTNGKIVCSCRSLYHLAVLYNYTLDEVHHSETTAYYSILSYVSFAINCVCLIISLIVYVYCRMGKTSICFQINFIFIIICLEILFIFGIGSDTFFNETWCKTLSVLFHFFVTSLFTWLMTNAWYTYVNLSNVIKNVKRDKTNICLVIGYGCPCVVLLFSLAIFYDGYGVKNNEMCWMTDTLMYALFIPPLAVFVLIKMIFVGMAVGVYFSPRSAPIAYDPSKVQFDTSEIYTVRDSIRASSLMLPVFIVTWVFGVLRMTQNTSEFVKYAFLFFNTLQGIVYLVAFCVINREITKRDVLWSYSTDQGYALDSPNLAALPNYFGMRAQNKHHINRAFEPDNLSRATAFNGHNLMESNKIKIPEEIYDMQHQWQDR